MEIKQVHQPISVVADGYAQDDGAAPRICAFETETIDLHAYARSSFELFLRGNAVGSNRPCLGFRNERPAKGPFQWRTYGEVHDAVVSIAVALTEILNLEPGQRVGILSKNCPNWTVTMLASSAAGMVVIPLYDSLTADGVAYICEHAQVAVVFVSEDCVNSFRDAWKLAPTVRKAVVFGDRDFSDLHKFDGTTDDLLSSDSRLVLFKDLLMLQHYSSGLENSETYALSKASHQLPEADLDTVFVIMYTSGTTGRPKGVMLTNRALVSSCVTGTAFLKHHGLYLTSDDCMLSYLPLAHIFAQQAEANHYAVGGRIGYYQGDVKHLLDDLGTLNPTLFVAVPRVYARIQQKILDTVRSGSALKQYLFNYAYESQLHNVKNGRKRSVFWDVLIFDRVRRTIFPNARVLLTGAAPMSPETNDFLKTVFNMPVMQGYGLTETLGGVACTPPNYGKSGTCGCPLPEAVIKLVSVPEMEYFTSDRPNPRGEVYVRAPTVMKGYFKDDAENAIAFPGADGWLASGDIGQWNVDGSLQIIDRKKNLFKLSQGEYVSPETLEQEYCKAELVSQIFVHGNSLESFLVAVVVPDVHAARQWAKQTGVDFGHCSLRDICCLHEFKQCVLQQFGEIRKNSGFKGYEAIVDVHFECEDLNSMGQGFTVENDLLTPSFKLKRPQLLKKYQDAINAMYEIIQ